MRLKTSEKFTQEMQQINSAIEILGAYTGDSNNILVRCNVCHNEWSPTPSNLLHRKSGCPKCAKNSAKEHNTFVAELREISPSIRVLGEYVTNKTPLLVTCDIDNHTWSPSPSDLLKGTGCPVCFAKRRTKDNLSFISELYGVNKNITVLSEYERAFKYVKVKCNIDGHIWDGVPHDMLKGVGCPKCAKYGFDITKSATMYVYRFASYYGFGVTNDMTERNKDHKRTFKTSKLPFDLVKTYQGSGKYMLGMEKHLKGTLPIYNTGIKGFKTEAVLEEDGTLLFREIEKYMIDNPPKL